MIEVRNLTKVFPGAVALDDLSFSVAKGEIVGFLGPNGAGKSTTMRILAGYLPPTSGSASVAGFDVVRQSLDVRRRVGYLPENNPLYLEMRVEEYLDFRATLRQVPRSKRTMAVGSALERCGLLEVRHRIVGHLSKGFRQRVGLADAIVHDPDMIILDEPTIGLDPNQIRHVRKVIRELGRERTVLLSTHILSEVEKMCSRVLIINGGRLVADGTPFDILKQTMTGRIHLCVRGETAGVREVLQRIPGVGNLVEVSLGEERSFFIEPKDHATVMPEIIRRASEAHWNVLELGPERLSLEDAFFELTDRASPVPDVLGADGKGDPA